MTPTSCLHSSSPATHSHSAPLMMAMWSGVHLSLSLSSMFNAEGPVLKATNCRKCTGEIVTAQEGTPCLDGHGRDRYAALTTVKHGSGLA